MYIDKAFQTPVKELLFRYLSFLCLARPICTIEPSTRQRRPWPRPAVLVNDDGRRSRRGDAAAPQSEGGPAAWKGRRRAPARPAGARRCPASCALATQAPGQLPPVGSRRRRRCTPLGGRRVMASACSARRTAPSRSPKTASAIALAKAGRELSDNARVPALPARARAARRRALLPRTGPTPARSRPGSSARRYHPGVAPRPGGTAVRHPPSAPAGSRPARSSNGRRSSQGRA